MSKPTKPVPMSVFKDDKGFSASDAGSAPPDTQKVGIGYVGKKEKTRKRSGARGLPARVKELEGSLEEKDALIRQHQVMLERQHEQLGVLGHNLEIAFSTMSRGIDMSLALYKYLYDRDALDVKDITDRLSMLYANRDALQDVEAYLDMSVAEFLANQAAEELEEEEDDSIRN